MQAIHSRIRRLRAELGTLGHVGLALMAAAAAFHFLAVAPLEARTAAMEQRVALAASRAPVESPAALGAAEKVDRVYEYLRKDASPTDWLAKLHGIGAATGLRMSQATYKTQNPEARLVRYEMVIPVSGTYPQIREFLQRALAEIPVMSIDQLVLKRESRNDAALHAELRLTLHMVKS